MALIGFAITAPGTLISGDYYADSGKSSYSGKSAYEAPGAGLLQESPYKLSLYGGASAVYNSNTTQLSNGTGAWMGVFDYGVAFASGDEGARGVVYGFNYDGNAYWYENSAAAAGRDPLEHYVGGFFGLNGGKTRFRLDTNYYRNNGNSIEFSGIDREARNAQSHDYRIDASVVRDLDRGSIEFGGGYFMRDFDSGTLLNDQNSYYGDFAFFHKPIFAPKSSLGVGLRVGTDDFTGNVNQDTIAPSFRWRYQASAKTTAYGSMGYESRSNATSTGGDSENFVYDVGVAWAVSDKTSLDFYAARTVRPSSSGVSQDYTSDAFILTISHDLPGQFQLAANVGYENADYFSSGAGTVIANLREDDFLRLGVSLSHPVRLCESVGGVMSVFYNYNENDSNLAIASFDQSIAGVRFGVTY